MKHNSTYIFFKLNSTLVSFIFNIDFFRSTQCLNVSLYSKETFELIKYLFNVKKTFYELLFLWKRNVFSIQLFNFIYNNKEFK